MLTRLSKISESTRFGSSANCSTCCQKPFSSQQPFSFTLPIPSANLVGEVLIGLIRMAGRAGPVVAVEVDREIPEDLHRQLAKLPAKLERHFKNEEAVYAGLIGRDSVACAEPTKVGSPTKWLANVSPVASVVVDRRRELEVIIAWKIEFRTDLPAEQIRVVIRYATRRRPDRDYPGWCRHRQTAQS